MKDSKVLILEGFSRDEVIHDLSRQKRLFSRKPVTIPTFYRWLDDLGIPPKDRYSEKDVDRLLGLCLHYLQGGKRTNIPKQLKEVI